MKTGFRVLFILFLITLSGLVASQDKTKLEREKKKLLAEIEITKKLLTKTSADKKNSLDQLETLKRQIELREKVIVNMSQELEQLNSEIEETNFIVVALEKDLKELKESYAKMLYYAYKNRSAINQLIFIFSAKSFNDAFSRMKYIQQFNDFRKRQAELIEETKQSLLNKNKEKEVQKADKQKLLDEEQSQREKLNEEKAKKNEIVTSLLKREKELRDEIRQKEEAAEKLNKKIEEVIKREIEAARKKAEKESKKGNVLTLTPEAMKLSTEFSQNQGKLPWPVEQGIVSRTFGEHQHPVLTKVKTFNNGVDIKTTSDSKIRAVFDGTVVSVLYNPAFQKAVMVRHGEFFSVYSNLKEVYVKPGDAVKLKQAIGLVYSEESEGQSDVHFELWKGTQKLNPSLWLHSQNP